MESKYGIFTVSLDFELYWGVRDKRTIEDYEKNLEGAKKAIEVILEVFEEYEVHATWATVGFLFAKNIIFSSWSPSVRSKLFLHK